MLDLVDSYLAVRRTDARAAVRGIVKFLFRRTRRLHLDCFYTFGLILQDFFARFTVGRIGCPGCTDGTLRTARLKCSNKCIHELRLRIDIFGRGQIMVRGSLVTNGSITHNNVTRLDIFL